MTKKEIAGTRRVAFKARADETVAQKSLKFTAHAEEFAVRGLRVGAHERVPVGRNLDGGDGRPQGFGVLATRE